MAFVIGHFFVFCNVVRMSRKLELVWAVVFVALALASHSFDIPRWPVSFALAFSLAVVFIVLEMRKPLYHGVFWERVNPGLPEWWARQQELGDAVA